MGIYVLSFIGMSLPPLNIFIPMYLAKKYKEKSEFFSKHAIDAMNLNFSLLIHTIVFLILFSVIELYFYNAGISVEKITNNLVILYLVFYYFLQMLYAMGSAVFGKPSNIYIWPTLFDDVHEINNAFDRKNKK